MISWALQREAREMKLQKKQTFQEDPWGEKIGDSSKINYLRQNMVPKCKRFVSCPWNYWISTNIELRFWHHITKENASSGATKHRCYVELLLFHHYLKFATLQHLQKLITLSPLQSSQHFNPAELKIHKRFHPTWNLHRSVPPDRSGVPRHSGRCWGSCWGSLAKWWRPEVRVASHRKDWFVLSGSTIQPNFHTGGEEVDCVNLEVSFL